MARQFNIKTDHEQYFVTWDRSEGEYRIETQSNHFVGMGGSSEADVIEAIKEYEIKEFSEE